MPRKRRPADPEARAIRKVVHDYLLSWYTWDRARLKSSLHPKVAKRLVWLDDKSGRSTLIEYPTAKLLRMVVSPFFGKKPPRSMAARAKGAASWTGYIRILDRFEDMCAVKTKARWGIDYLHLAKWNGEWKIINVLWK